MCVILSNLFLTNDVTFASSFCILILISFFNLNENYITGWKAKNKQWIIMSLAGFGLLISSIATTLTVVPFFIIVILTNRQLRKKICIKQYCISTFFALCLSSFFTLPMLSELVTNKYNLPVRFYTSILSLNIGTYYKFFNNYFGWLYNVGWLYESPAGLLTIAFWLLAFLLIAITIYLCIVKSVKINNGFTLSKKIQIISLMFFAFYAFIPETILLHIPIFCEYLKTIQFGIRLSLLMNFFLAASVVSIFKKITIISKKHRHILAF